MNRIQRRGGTVPVLLLLALAVCSAGILQSSPAQAEPFAYITNYGDDTVSVIDAATGTVVDTVSVGNGPLGVAVNEAGTYVYITNSQANPATVSVIDTATNTVSTTITLANGRLGPFGIAISATENKAYVANHDWQRVLVIDTNTNTELPEIIGGSNPFGVAVNSTGAKAYTANSWSNNVTVIATSTDSVTTTIQSVGNDLAGIAASPIAARAYVANDNGLAVINTSLDEVGKTITVGTNPMCVTITPDGSYAYVSNYDSDTVSVINTATENVTDTIDVGQGPMGLCARRDGSQVYVANETDNTVSVIDTTSRTVVDTITVGNAPFAMGNFFGPEPSRIELASLSAVMDPASTTVNWETASEMDNAGFRVYRAEESEGEFVLITESMVPADGTPTQGSQYSLIDSSTEQGKTYWYRLEDIDLAGKSTFHGPVKAEKGPGLCGTMDNPAGFAVFFAMAALLPLWIGRRRLARSRN